MVYRITQHIPGKQYGWPGIRGKTLKMLQELIADGYIICSEDNAGRKYIALKKYFPTICKIRMYNKAIIFFEDKTEVAARAFLGDMNKKIMSYQELKQVTKVFGVDLSIQEKQTFFGKTNHNIRRKRRKRKIIHSSISKENQMKIDDFFGRFLHSDVLMEEMEIRNSQLLFL